MNLFVHRKVQQHNIYETKSNYPGRYYQVPTGEIYPSVTTVLSAMDKSDLEEWRKRIGEKEADLITRQAILRGIELHLVLEKYLNNDPSYSEYMSYGVRELFNQLKPKLQENVQEVIASEIPLYSHKIKTAGRCDCIAIINSKPHIIDFKNSRKLKDETMIQGYQCQASAYAVMANELYDLRIQDFVIMIANVTENYPTIIFGKVKDHISEFVTVRKKYAIQENKKL